MAVLPDVAHHYQMGRRRHHTKLALTRPHPLACDFPYRMCCARRIDAHQLIPLVVHRAHVISHPTAMDALAHAGGYGNGRSSNTKAPHARRAWKPRRCGRLAVQRSHAGMDGVPASAGTRGAADADVAPVSDGAGPGRGRGLGVAFVAWRRSDVVDAVGTGTAEDRSGPASEA